ncbi:hypothetical protein [Bordetella hinzii]|uniref:hypothetical protein n=1 Tax=Bordetella hinzii TaxID=103855 RepID=UPI001151B919|nr:hypothetical protein [Bordetella hinzii]
MSDMRKNTLELTNLRFMPEVYQAIEEGKLNALPLLECAEDARMVATGVSSVLMVLINNLEEKQPLSDFTIDQLLGLCRQSLLLLNDKIEHTADFMSSRADELEEY